MIKKKAKSDLVSTERIIKTIEKTNSKKEKKIKFQFYLKKLENVVLKESQQVYSQKIKNSEITIAIGQAGCLTHNQKIIVFKMKSKNFLRETVNEEICNNVNKHEE